MSNQLLATIDNAERVLASVKTPQDIAQAVAAMGVLTEAQRHIDNSKEAMNELLSRVLKLKWQAGRILQTMQKNQGGGDGSNQHQTATGNEPLPVAVIPTYSELGINKMQAQRMQLIANVPEDVIDDWIAERGADNKLITEAAAVSLGRKYEPDEPDEPDDNIVSEIPPTIVIHGDMLEELTHINKAQLVIADPPYNVTGWEWDKFESSSAFIEATTQWLTAIKSILADEYNLFWFCSPQYIAPVEQVLNDLELPIKSRIVWHRRNMAMGSDSEYKFIDTWEMIYHCGNRRLNFPIKWDSARFDVQTFAVPQTNFTDRKVHPTQKPIALIERLVEFGSYAGDHVLDPFAGGGTTGAACLSVGDRLCTLIEREASYVEVINGRL